MASDGMPRGKTVQLRQQLPERLEHAACAHEFGRVGRQGRDDDDEGDRVRQKNRSVQTFSMSGSNIEVITNS